ALYATNHIKVARNLKNIICLATPFLVCGPRARLSLLTRLAWFGLSTLIALPILATVGSLLAVSSKFVGDFGISKIGLGYQSELWALWSIWLVVAVTVYLVMRIYLNRSAKQRMKLLSWSAAIKPRLLAIYYRLDEAEIYLNYLDLGASRLARLLWKFIAASFVAVLSYTLVSFFRRSYAPELFNLPIFSSAHPWWGEGGGPPRRGAWAELALTVYFLFVPTLLLIAFFLPVLRGNPWGYGWEWPSTTLMLD